MKRLALMGAVILTPLFVGLAMVAMVLSGENLPRMSVSPDLLENVLVRGTARVLVRLNTPFTSEDRLRPGGVIMQRNIIRNVQERVITALIEIPGTEVIYQYNSTPLLAIRISASSLPTLQTLGGLILRIDEQCTYLDADLCDFSNRGS